MAGLPDLLFRIRAQGDTARAFAATRGEVDKTKASLAGLGRAFTGALAFGGIAALTQLPRILGDIVDEASRLVDASKRIGITTDALQELGHAAMLGGVEMDSLVGNLEQFARRVADAGQGTGELKALLDANGISLRDGNGRLKDQTELLAIVADLMANVSSEQDKMNIAVMAFGRGGADMVNVLEGGSAALTRTAEEARRLGKVIDEELLKDAERIGDEWETFTSGLATNFKSFTLEAISQLDDLKQGFVNFFSFFPKLGLRLAGFRDIPVEPESGKGSASEDQSLAAMLGGGGATVIPQTGGGRGGKTDAERAQEQIDKVTESLLFQSAQLGRTARDQAIYNALQQAGIDINHEAAPAVMEYAAAVYDQQQALQSLDMLRDAASDVLGGIISGLREGEKMTEILGNAFERLADRLIASGLEQLIGSLFGARGTAGTGFLGSLLGAFLPGFAEGGSMVLGGAGGPDSNIYAFRGTPGERVTFDPPGGRGRGERAMQTKVIVEAVPNPYFDIRVRQVSGEEAQKITAAGIAANERQNARRAVTHQ